jgi:TolB-like protein
VHYNPEFLMPLSAGQKLAAYEIISALGAGGMGEVYRARDTRLGREVALKILPPDVINEPGRLERFDREARAIAALNHPHIVTIYSTEEAGGIRFLTMELVDGCTLSDLVMPEGMAMPRFLEIAIPLADALAAAHQKQITHRDLKPGNVMMSNDGRVKVLDFGLARVGGADAGEQTLMTTQAPITQGMIVGTVPYMSPEQVEGRPLDPRSDLFSLGIIFYELLSGDRPFKGSSSPALMSAILRDTPAGIGQRRGDLPEGLDRLISRMLKKRPEDRVQTARDVYNELRHIKGDRSAGVQRKISDRATTDNLRIAVLPFTVRGADADAEAIASALTDDIAASLAKFPGLSVVASQTTRAFKDSPLDVRQIAERVGARYVVTGNVRKAGATLRVTAQVIDADGGEQLWIENYDRKLDNGDLFAIQDDLTDHIVATVADKYGVLARSMVHSVNRAGAVRDMTPAQLLVRGWGFQHLPLGVAHAEMRDAVEARLEEDPNNAHMWAELASLCVVEHSLRCNPRPDPLGRAQRAARRAIEIDRGNQSGWLWLAVANFHLHDRAGFDEASERAIRINSRNASALAWIGNIRTHMGEYERGCAMTERAMTVNPAHPGWLHFAVFNRRFVAGEYEQALQAARRVNMHDFFWMHFAIAAACGHLGRTGEGEAAYDAMVTIAPLLGDKAHLREFVSRWYWSEEMIEALIEGVQRARHRT